MTSLGPVVARRRRRPLRPLRVAQVSFTTALLVLVAAYVLLPIVWILLATTKNGQQLVQLPPFAVPRHIMLGQNLRGVLTAGGGIFVRWLVNSFGYGLLIAVGSTYLAALAGYALAKLRFFGRRVLAGLVVASLMVPSTVLVIPIFILESRVHLTNSYPGVILPLLLSAFAVWFMMVYANEALPGELIEAAQVDGAGQWRIFHRVALPLLRPGLATLLLISFVTTWNNYFLPLVLLENQRLFPVTVALITVMGGGGAQIMGTAISILPTLILFPFLQRAVSRGLSLGAAGVD